MGDKGGGSSAPAQYTIPGTALTPEQQTKVNKDYDSFFTREGRQARYAELFPNGPGSANSQTTESGGTTGAVDSTGATGTNTAGVNKGLAIGLGALAGLASFDPVLGYSVYEAAAYSLAKANPSQADKDRSKAAALGYTDQDISLAMKHGIMKSLLGEDDEDSTSKGLGYSSHDGNGGFGSDAAGFGGNMDGGGDMGRGGFGADGDMGMGGEGFA